MSLYLYVDRGSVLHRLHPVAKLLSLLFFFVATFIVDHPGAVLPITVVVALLIVAAEATPNIWRLRLLFLFIALFTLMIWAFFYGEGKTLQTLGPLRVTAEGLLFGVGMALKLATFLAIGLVFLSTTKVEEFAYALSRLGMPYRMGFALTLAFRLIPVFLDAALTVVEAQRCRGLDFHRGNLFQRIFRYIPVIVPVFMGALRKADHMAMALETRGFSSGRERTSYVRFFVGGRDFCALAVSVLIMAMAMVARYQGYGIIQATR